MADVAIRMITTETGVGVPIHGAIALDLESGGIILVKILAVIFFHRFRIARTVCNRASNAEGKRYRDEYRRRKVQWFHGVSSVISHHPMACGFYNSNPGRRLRRRPGSAVPISACRTLAAGQRKYGELATERSVIAQASVAADSAEAGLRVG